MAYLITFYFIALDFATGLFQALATGTFESKVMRQGLFHKVALLLVMLLGWLMDYAQQFVDLGVNLPVGGRCVRVHHPDGSGLQSGEPVQNESGADAGQAV